MCQSAIVMIRMNVMELKPTQSFLQFFSLPPKLPAQTLSMNASQVNMINHVGRISH
jgi:hypothetical protein